MPLVCKQVLHKWGMLEHPAWHAVHASALAEDRETASHIIQARVRKCPRHAAYAQRPPSAQAPDDAATQGEGRGRRPPKGVTVAYRRRPRGRWCSPPGIRPRRAGHCPPVGPPLGAGTPDPLAPVPPGDYGATADPAAMLVRDS